MIGLGGLVKKNIKMKWFTFCTYLLLVLAVFLIGFVMLNNNKVLNNVITSFFEVAENRAFDYRQTLRVIHKQPIPSDEIIVLAIDDASLEMLWDKYGEWPIPRNVYSDVINYIEQKSPQSIIFDLLFIKSIRKEQEADKALTSTIDKYNNIYVGMNFDAQDLSIRTPIDLPKRLEVKLDNKSKVDFAKKYSFPNCRPILSELLNSKVHVGITNVTRNSDGIIRKMPTLMMYKNKYYPSLSFNAGSNYILGEATDKFVIDKNSHLLLKDIKLPLTNEGDVILNWYGQSGTHKIYPFYKLINEIDGKFIGEKLDFKNKIVIIGTTAVALHDTKSVPIQNNVYPGVEIHATFLNNILDNNFIKQTNKTSDYMIILAVVAIVGLIVMYSTSTIFALLSTILFSIAYLFISYYLMVMCNLWIPVVLPLISIIMAFAISFLAKYLIKSRDFEYQYKLATVDGLTELHNHRYFQEALKNQIEISKRYEQEFSLILIDIDYFKKFNDTYGHQAGDAVLKQVAQVLKKNSRTTDFVCRYGGEEMAIILPNTKVEEAFFNANRINKAVAEKEFHLNSTEVGNVTISLGVATFPNDADDAPGLIEHADKGLYYAKEHGRNQVGRI